jgi:hypothetical protein
MAFLRAATKHSWRRYSTTQGQLDCTHTAAVECWHGPCRLKAVQGGYQGDVWLRELKGWLVNRKGYGYLYPLEEIKEYGG